MCQTRASCAQIPDGFPMSCVFSVTNQQRRWQVQILTNVNYAVSLRVAHFGRRLTTRQKSPKMCIGQVHDGLAETANKRASRPLLSQNRLNKGFLRSIISLTNTKITENGQGRLSFRPTLPIFTR